MKDSSSVWLDMELTGENNNYIKLSYILLDVVAKHLRKYFIKLWDAKYPSEKWNDDIDKKNHKLQGLLIKNQYVLKMVNGNEEIWDTSTLLNAILDSNLKLMQDGSGEKKDIEDISSFYNHLLSPSWSDADFKSIMTRMQILSKNRFGEDAEKEVGDIEYSPVTPEMKQRLEQLLKGIKPNLKLSTENKNYVRFAHIILNVAAKHLKRYFIKLWDAKYPNEKWKERIDNRKRKLRNLLIKDISKQKMLDGNEEEWDTSTLLYAILESDLKLMTQCRPYSERVPPLSESEEIDIIRGIRYSHYDHVLSMSCSDLRFKNILVDIKRVAKTRFGEEAGKEIENIDTSPTTTFMTTQVMQLINTFKTDNELLTEGLSSQIEKFQDALSVRSEGFTINALQSTFILGNVEAVYQTQLNEEVREKFERMEGKFGNVEQKVDKLHEKLGPSKGNLSNSPLQPCTKSDIDGLKHIYKVQYQKHSIHKVDEHHRIVMKEVNVNEFAVKVKISNTRPAGVTFKDETRKHFELLKGVAGNDIDLSDLVKHDDRVSLIRGIPGIGKSILTKQLAFLWANDEIFTQFELCIMAECRDINDFVLNEGKKLEKHELMSEFLKSKFGFDFRSWVSTLFIFDGLDELSDINSDDSLIWQLLDVKNTKYAMARVILTGRPHIQGKLERQYKNIGGLQKFEIQGLSDEQIRDYVNKFAPCEEDIVNINKVIDSSKEYIKIISVPEFLNSLCCVTMLSDGQTLKNAVELHVWVLYLLLKEHAEKESPSQKLCYEIFQEYSCELRALCEICHELLSKNRIIFEGNVKLRLLESGKGAEFLEGLFVDVSDNRKKRFQFKHLTLMEFLSAVHICRMRDRMEIIKSSLKNEFYQVVIFSCELIGGCKYDGIIRDMFVNDMELKGINVQQFLPSVLKLVRLLQRQQHSQLFQLSIDIIMCFINKDVTSKKFIISTVKTLRCEMYGFYTESMRKVRELCEPLINEFNCNEDELKETFKNVLVEAVRIEGDVESLTFVKYLPNVRKFEVIGIRTTALLIRNEVNEIPKCKTVGIYDCELTDDVIVDMGIANYELKEFRLLGCRLNKCSFMNVCNWAWASVKEFKLWHMCNIEQSWWDELANAIANAKEKNNGSLVLRELVIRFCAQEMSEEMQMKIVRCGVDLIIDERVVNYPSRQDDDAYDPQSIAASAHPPPSVTPLVSLKPLISSAFGSSHRSRIPRPLSSTPMTAHASDHHHRPNETPPASLTPSTSDASRRSRNPKSHIPHPRSAK